MKYPFNKSWFFLLLFTSLYFLFREVEYTKEKIDAIISTEGIIHVKILCIVLLLTIIIIKITLKIPLFRIMLICIILFVISNENMISTKNLTGKTQTDIKNFETGDIVLFRSYHSYDLPEYLFYRIFHSLLSYPYMGHVGMVVKNHDNQIYILHSTEDIHWCENLKQEKNGVVLQKFENVMSEYDGLIFVYKTNFSKHISWDSISKLLNKDEQKYNKKLFGLGEGKIGCVENMRRILQHHNILNSYSILPFLPCHFNNSYIFNPNFSVEKIPYNVKGAKFK